MSEARIELQGEGRFAVRGELSFATVPALLRSSLTLFEAAPRLDIDLSGVERSDSAGLALLVEWMREARRHDKPVRFLNTPRQMLAIARVSSLDQILPLVRD
ncbi:STAS domain-containing protein [Thiohalobacter sp. IOR34]|uniref:STAS domain-containing protein n=1 Tax=Thiohalobacter sp. IOR34 TaxID=3057176 RepID=UPI0025B10380|nr:STAS domain-containing protein [Thiohalobacter sp. IOR34]WJW74847.1 STAS domain-containing protein [Thiohalobacter sp. IOR34]